MACKAVLLKFMKGCSREAFARDYSNRDNHPFGKKEKK